MRIFAMKTNHVPHPLGFDLTTVTFSWKVDDTPSTRAFTTRVEIARDFLFSDVLHDSDHDTWILNTGYTPDFLPLEPRTRYWWRVTVRGDTCDEAVSEPAWFETGKMNEAWTAKWIVSPVEKDSHPCFKRDFVLQESFTSARAYACGLGIYELYINGHKAGDEFLAPGLHSYDNWLQVQTYDVTSLLKPGDNTIIAILGDGWAKGRFGPDGKTTEMFCGESGFISELHVSYDDGESVVINSNKEWLYSLSHVLESSIYDGETYDATREISYSENAIESADYQKKWGLGPLSDRLSLPVKAMLEIKPSALLKTPAGEDVLDMGQNMVGHIRFIDRSGKGDKVSLYFGEVLQEENFYRENLRTAKAEYHYISNGEQTEVRPFFTFYGFRYVKLEGFKDIDINDFTGVVLYSDMQQTGNIETSDESVNRLFQNVIWGQRGNFLDVPTDCPQRDERFGWTGDAQIFCETAAWNMDVYAFFMKYLRDMEYDQAALGGKIPHVVPDMYPRGREKSRGGAACGWADAATIIPHTLFDIYGDSTVIRKFFPMMKAWVDWIKAEDDRSGSRRLWTTGFHFGDWLALDAPVPGSPFGATDTGFIASAYYYNSALLTEAAAYLIDDPKNQEVYNKLSNEIKSAILNEYFTPNGRIAVKTQTAMVLALQFGLYPDGKRERLIDSLKIQLVQDGMKLKTGFLGTPALCGVLSDNNAHNFALRLFFRKEMPGWLYPVSMGATTIWERWDSILPDGKISDTGMNSLNHYAYGCIVSWMYRNICGIAPLIGFSRIQLKPRPCKQLEFARASFDSPHGIITCGWKRLQDGMIEVEIEIPFGATGYITLPVNALEALKELFTDVLEENGNACADAPPGKYRILYTPPEPKTFDLSTPVYEIIADEQAGAIFTSIPALSNLPENLLRYTLAELLEYIDTSFPHFADAAKALAAKILSMNREQ